MIIIYTTLKKKKKKGKKRKPMKFFKKKIEKQKLSATGLVCGETIKPTRHQSFNPSLHSDSVLSTDQVMWGTQTKKLKREKTKKMKTIMPEAYLQNTKKKEKKKETMKRVV